MEMEKKCPYINRDDVAQMLIEGVLEDNSSPQYAEYIRLLVYSVPSADVAPVRHGRWEAIEWGVNHSEEIIIGRVYQCSECKRIIDLEHDETLNDYPYCHCGAKMDGEENV